MTIKFEDGKIYVEKGSKKPYTTIYEAAEYNNGKLKTLYIDTYWFDGLVDPATQGRIYEGSGSLERAENFNIKNFKEIGKLGVDFAVYKNSNLLEIKPSYSDLQTALEKIINAKPSEFANWHKMAAYCQKVAKEVSGAE